MSSFVALEGKSETTREVLHCERGKLVLLTVLALGSLLRLGNAAYRFLNPDEALHYLLSLQPSFSATYRATLTTAHPPLLILLLHGWGSIAHSELFLRLPSVLAGTLFCAVMFLWLERVTDYVTAFIALMLLLFSPALIQVSAEVRQYGLLLLFCSLSLYFLDWALEEDSVARLLLSTAALYLALLTHYSSLIFALTLSLYGLMRLLATRARSPMILVWVGAQLGALALVSFLLLHHVSRLKASGLAQSIAGSYLRRSVLQPGQNPLWFVGRANLRLFHYFFSQGAIGALALALFLCGLFLLLRTPRDGSQVRSASSRQVGLLLAFPLVVNCALALVRVYPYGGTRHNSYLAMFAIPGIALTLARAKLGRSWVKPLGIGIILAVCNLFPSPQGEYIRARDQSRRLMTQAIASLRSLPAESTILTDDQGGLLLSYYLCQAKVAQIEQQPFQLFLRSRCGSDWVISLDPELWIFKAETFPSTFDALQRTYDLSPGTQLWLFQAGWFIDQEYALRDELHRLGCSPHQEFGRNMFWCRLTVGGPRQATSRDISAGTAE